MALPLVLGALGSGLLGGLGGGGGPKGHPTAQQLSLNLTNALNNQTAFGTGMANLNQILASQGQVSPLSRNRAITNVLRRGEASQLQQSQSAAQRGLQNSGALQAINAAIGASAQDRAAAVDADFIAQEEQRKRDDLGLLLSLIINPSLQQVATASGLASNISSNQMARQGATVNALSSLLGAFLQSR